MSDPAPRGDPLVAIQHGLESLYRVRTDLDVTHFLLSQEQREHYYPGRAPSEQLLVREHEDGLDMALYLDDAVLAGLRQNDPREGIGEHNLGPLLLVLEGVSHFIYTVDRARQSRQVSALELELQAEVDKYVTLVLLTWQDGHGAAAGLIERLFHHVRFADDLSAEEHDRYRRANDNAARYADGLLRRHLRRGALSGFLTEVRRFWRLSLSGKVSHINSEV